MSSRIGSPQKKIALDTEQDSIPHPCLPNGGPSASGARPSTTTSTDQNTATSDVTRASSKDHIGGDVGMKETVQTKTVPDAQTPSGSDSRRRITTKRESHVKSETSNRAPLNSTFREGSWGDAQEHAVAVTTQEAMDGYCEKMKDGDIFIAISVPKWHKHSIASTE